MLKRQRMLLGLIYFASERAEVRMTRTRLMKCAFLMSKSLESKGLCPPYDFVPYHYGPFSFTLYRDLWNLRRGGRIESGNADAAYVPAEGKACASAGFEALSWDTRQAIGEVVCENGAMPNDDLLRSVYSRFPWYATLSRRKDLLPPTPTIRPVAKPAVYTIGYEGKSVDQLFDSLLRRGIQAIADVRRNPMSRKYGFSKKALRSIAAKLKLSYTHFPKLGIPTEERKGLSDPESYAALLDRYEQTMLPQGSESALLLSTDLSNCPTALLCMEADPSFCHRGRLAKWVAGQTDLPIEHLR